MSQPFGTTPTPTPIPITTARYGTADERLKALRGVGDNLDAVTRTSPILEELAAAPAAPVPFGARTPEVAREAAELVTKRRDKNFRNAPFAGEDISADTEELRLALAIKAKADAFTQLSAQAVAGCSGKLGEKLRAVVKVVGAGLLDPFYEDKKGLESDSAAMRSLIDAYNASIQSSKSTLGALRGENVDLVAEVSRLAAENDALRGAGPTEARPMILTRTTTTQPTAPRRGRKHRR